jgi:hypothetical protein
LLDLYRTADDLETTVGYYLLDHVPASQKLFEEQLVDLQNAIAPYNKARSTLSMNHDDYEVVIRDVTRNDEALGNAARSLLDSDAAGFGTFAPPVLPAELKQSNLSDADRQAKVVQSHKSLAGIWSETRTGLKAQRERLRAGIERFEQQLLASTGERPPACQ